MPGVWLKKNTCQGGNMGAAFADLFLMMQTLLLSSLSLLSKSLTETSVQLLQYLDVSYADACSRVLAQHNLKKA